jgi:hypothetical protein
MVCFPVAVQTKVLSGGKTVYYWILSIKSTPLLLLIMGKHATYGLITGSPQSENMITLICSPLPLIKTSAAGRRGQPAMTII